MLRSRSAWPDGGDSLERYAHALGRLEHPREHRRAKREVIGRARSLGLEPGCELAHRLRGGGVCLFQLRLQPGVGYLGVHGCHVLEIEVRETREGVDTIVDPRSRHRRAEVRADLRRRVRNRLRVGDIGTHPLLERRVGLVEICVRIEPAQVVVRAAERPFRLGKPEEVVVDPRQQIVAFECLLRTEARGVEPGGPGPRGAKSRDFPFDRRRAEVLHATVILVASRVDAEDWIGREIVLEERGDEPVPIGVRRRGAGLRSRGRGCATDRRLAIAAGREQQHRKPATDSRNCPHGPVLAAPKGGNCTRSVAACRIRRNAGGNPAG